MGFRPCGASYFLLLRQKKVSKEKATLGRCRLRRFPALLGSGGGCGTRASPSDSPRPFSASPCVARHLSRGPVKRPVLELGCLNNRFHFWPFFPVDRGNRFLTLHRSSPDAFGVPVEGAEQRRRAGGLRLALSEPQASLASRPACRVAQGTGEAGAAPGVAFCLRQRRTPPLATFFWRSKRKYARQQGGTPCQLSEKHQNPRRGGNNAYKSGASQYAASFTDMPLRAAQSSS
jgi:hypothetical protein